MAVAVPTPLLAISVFAWVMIGLPIILVVVAAVMYLSRPKRTAEEIEREERASRSDAPGPTGPTGRSPGA